MRQIEDILSDTYGVNAIQAPKECILWAWETMARESGVALADECLELINRRRERFGKIPAYKPYGYAPGGES